MRFLRPGAVVGFFVSNTSCAHNDSSNDFFKFVEHKTKDVSASIEMLTKQIPTEITQLFQFVGDSQEGECEETDQKGFRESSKKQERRPISLGCQCENTVNVKRWIGLPDDAGSDFPSIWLYFFGQCYANEMAWQQKSGQKG